MGYEMAGRFKRERTYVYLWLIQVVVKQKPAQYYKISYNKEIKKKILVAKLSTKVQKLLPSKRYFSCQVLWEDQGTEVKTVLSSKYPK